MSWWELKPRKQIKFWSYMPCDSYFPVQLLRTSSSETRSTWFWIFGEGTDLHASVFSFIKWEWYSILLLATSIRSPPPSASFQRSSIYPRTERLVITCPRLLCFHGAWLDINSDNDVYDLVQDLEVQALAGSSGFSRCDVLQQLVGFPFLVTSLSATGWLWPWAAVSCNLSDLGSSNFL